MVKIIQLEKKDENKLLNLINIVEKNLKEKDWWLPISDIEKRIYFKKNKILFLGAFDNEKLVGAIALFVDKNEYGTAFQYLSDKKNKNIAKIGRAMVLPEYRRKNIMNLMTQKALDKAKAFNFNSVFAIAHPENVASVSYLQKIGFKHIKTFETPNGYLRDLFFLENIN